VANKTYEKDMINSIVTQRFIKCHNKLREQKIIKSSRQFAMELDYLPQSLSEILKGRRDVTIEVIRKAVEVYNINPGFIFSGEGPLILKDEDSHKSFRVLTVVTDDDDAERIVHVPIPAHAGYVSELDDSKFIQGLPSFSLPDYKYKVGTHRCFDVMGDSMEPTLFEGDKVVCSFIEPALWESAIKDSYVYVVVTKDDILVRRAYNQIKSNKQLELKSDNTYYENYITPLSNIQEIWYVRAKISPFLPSPNRVNNHLFDEISALRESLREQSKTINEMSETISRFINR
jgi:transcriptional regulator with XRE-family HTH domain